jgi:hypothetical protein
MTYEEATKLFTPGLAVVYVSANNRLVFGSVREVIEDLDGTARVRVQKGPGEWDYASPAADRVAVNG